MANISTNFSVWSTVEASNQPDTSDPNTIPADMRAIQSALRTIFPNVNAALTPTHTQLNYVAGVTSAIQTQLDAKLPTASLYALSSQAEAEAGTDNTKYMSSLRVKQSIDANAPTPASASTTVQGIVELATNAETPTTDATRAVTPAGFYASSLGIGQTWQTVVRTSGVTYYNTTGRPIYLTLNVAGTGTGQTSTIAVNGVTVSYNVSNASTYQMCHAGALIPDEASYVLSYIGSTNQLAELR